MNYLVWPGLYLNQFAPGPACASSKERKKGRLKPKGIGIPGEASGGIRLSEECGENTTADGRYSLLECMQFVTRGLMMCQRLQRQGDLRNKHGGG